MLTQRGRSRSCWQPITITAFKTFCLNQLSQPFPLEFHPNPPPPPSQPRTNKAFLLSLPKRCSRSRLKNAAPAPTNKKIDSGSGAALKMAAPGGSALLQESLASKFSRLFKFFTVYSKVSVFKIQCIWKIVFFIYRCESWSRKQNSPKIAVLQIWMTSVRIQLRILNKKNWII